MARARNIKPGFFKNYDLADLGPHAQLLFAGLWCLADREGRLEDKPRLIKAEVFPYYEVDVNGELTELARLKIIDRYQADGIDVIEVLNFKKHQTPHNTEKLSILPARPHQDSLTVDSPKHNGGKTPDSLIHRFTDSLIPDSSIPDSPPAAKSPEAVAMFDEAWDAYPKRPGASRPDSLKAWMARVKSGVVPAVMLDGVRRYAEYVTVKKTEPDYIKQPSTFFGPGKHFESDWKVYAAPPRASPGYQTQNEKARAFADRLTGNQNVQRNAPTIIDIN